MYYSPEVLLVAVSFPTVFSDGLSTIHLVDVGGGLALNVKLAVASLGCKLETNLTRCLKLNVNITIVELTFEEVIFSRISSLYPKSLPLHHRVSFVGHLLWRERHVQDCLG